jgi:ATP synthase protein I
MELSRREAEVRRVAEGRREAEGKGRAQGLETGWTIMSYLLGGMLAYGGIGWLVGRAVHNSMIFPIGMLAGLVISLVYIVYRFGKQQAMSSTPNQGKPQPRQAGSGTTASPKGDDR